MNSITVFAFKTAEDRTKQTEDRQTIGTFYKRDECREKIIQHIIGKSDYQVLLCVDENGKHHNAVNAPFHLDK